MSQDVLAKRHLVGRALRLPHEIIKEGSDA